MRKVDAACPTGDDCILVRTALVLVAKLVLASAGSVEPIANVLFGGPYRRDVEPLGLIIGMVQNIHKHGDKIRMKNYLGKGKG